MLARGYGPQRIRWRRGNAFCRLAGYGVDAGRLRIVSGIAREFVGIKTEPIHMMPSGAGECSRCDKEPSGGVVVLFSPRKKPSGQRSGTDQPTGDVRER